MARRIPVADKAVFELAASLREAELVETDMPDSEAIVRVLEECSEEDAGVAGDASPGARLATVPGSLAKQAHGELVS